MRKIPTLFTRNPDRPELITRDVHPACQWVLDGDGVATRKYDGTCVMLDEDGQWWARREVKPGKNPPTGFVAEQTDEATGKTVGWEPAEQSPFAKFLAEALDARLTPQGRYPMGTYELCGPKVNGNPEGFEHHTLVRHADAEELDAPRTFDELMDWLEDHEEYEGVVWHHPDGRMAKMKRRDALAVGRAETRPPAPHL